MGAGASAPVGVGSSPAPIGGSFAGGYPAVVPPASTPIATPTATPSSAPQGGKGGPTAAGGAPSASPMAGFAGAYPAVTPSVSPVAPTAPQQPYVNPYMQTYGQNNTPQQQMFNRFQPPQQQFRQPVAQPAQGPVYADQSLNAPGNQPQQFQQPQYGRFGRGFMPQNRGGYDRQIDQLRGQGQYGQQYPQKQLGFMSDLMSGQQQSPVDAEAEYRARLPQIQPAYNSTPQQVQQLIKQQNDAYNSYRPQQDMGYGGGYGQQPVAVQPSAPAGGKGGNPTVQLPPPPKQDGTPGSWSTYI